MRWVLALSLASMLNVGLVARAADAEPKYTIKEVMKKAHTPDGGLLKKIVSGEGTKARRRAAGRTLHGARAKQTAAGGPGQLAGKDE